MDNSEKIPKYMFNQQREQAWKNMVYRVLTGLGLFGLITGYLINTYISR